MLNLWLIPLPPFLGFVVLGLLGRRLGRRVVGGVASGCVGLSLLASLRAAADLLALPESGRRASAVLAPWIGVDGFRADWGLLLDPLSAVMILVVSGVGFLIHVYAVGYMAHERDYARFFAALNLFTFSMLMLVLADNYLLLYLFWEAVGLCSYLLIGFWYEKPAAAEAGKKAFIVNRVGDFGFGLGVMLLWTTLGTLGYAEVFAAAQRLPAGGPAVTAITLLLFVGATGKSAQMPLYVWLPDAMEGPTPVSALIHAATMVTAGVYMVARSAPLFGLAPVTLQVVAWTGALTAVLAATIAVVQTDIKRVIAYSTISQLGYMFLGAGLGAYAAAIFHLATHAAFKALLFLGAGSVIHGLHGEQDLTRMGGLRRHMPVTAATFLVAALANAGVFPLAGFWSKDEILHAALAHREPGLLVLGLAGAFLTGLYMLRAYYLAFEGEPRGEQKAHESAAVMTGPLLVLAALACGVGFVGVPPRHGPFHRFIAPALPAAPHGGEGGLALALVSLGMALAGIGLATWLYRARPEMPARLAARYFWVHRLLRNAYYVDAAYDRLLVRPVQRGALGLWRRIDEPVIDGTVDGLAACVQAGALWLRRVQTGYVMSYVLSFLVGVVGVLGYLVFRR